MNWTFLLFSFCIAVLAGAIGATTLARMFPHWSERRRLWTAALLLPALTLFFTAVGIVVALATGPGEGENMQDLIVASIATMGALFALLALVGGLIGAALRQRGMKR